MTTYNHTTLRPATINNSTVRHDINRRSIVSTLLKSRSAVFSYSQLCNCAITLHARESAAQCRSGKTWELTRRRCTWTRWPIIVHHDLRSPPWLSLIGPSHRRPECKQRRVYCLVAAAKNIEDDQLFIVLFSTFYWFVWFAHCVSPWFSDSK